MATLDNHTPRFQADLTIELLRDVERTLDEVLRELRQIKLDVWKLEGMAQHGSTDYKTKRQSG